MSSVAPFLIFFVGAGLVAVTKGVPRAIVLLAIPVIGAANLLNMAHGDSGFVSLFDYTLTLIRADKLSLLFGYLFHLAAFIGVVFSLHVKDRIQPVAATLYSGSALGVLFAGDLITVFIFWEFLAVTSVFLILARGSDRATRAALRYLLIQVGSGFLLLSGILVRAWQTGSIAVEPIALEGLAAWLILLAIGIKCCFPLLHNWLTDAYPEATPTGTVFLSAFTTKTAIYVLARCFAGETLLVYVGAIMAMFPIFYAVIENDLRRVLAYSLINQLGFMVCGIGIGTALAVNGAVAHAFSHIIYKALLFMSMGAVLYRTGRINGSELGGLYKSMPWTAGFCIVGAASISAFPLFSGFISKSMVLTAALKEGHPIVWLALLFASAGVFHHAGIKIPYFAFFAHDSGIRTKEAPLNMLIAMALAAGICIFIGVYPWPLYAMLPFPVDYAPYTAEHVLTQSQLLFFSALAFVWLNLTRLYPPELPSVNIDAEWSYRKALPAAGRAAFAAGRRARALALDGARHLLRLVFAAIYRQSGPGGSLARNWQTGSMAFWTTVVLAMYLILAYV